MLGETGLGLEGERWICTAFECVSWSKCKTRGGLQADIKTNAQKLSWIRTGKRDHRTVKLESGITKPDWIKSQRQFENLSHQGEWSNFSHL